jgi:hypothetical protein
MKTTAWPLWIAFACTALSFAGCLEIETKTTVNTDGTFVRSIDFKDEDTTKSDNEMALFETDSSWTSVRHRLNDTSRVRTMTRVFSSSDDLAKALRGTRGKTLEVRVGFDRKFRWFTTEYVYSETLLCFNLVRAVPLTQYMTPAEMEFWLAHENSNGKEVFRSVEDSLAFDRIDKIGPEWDTRNKFEGFFTLFTKGVEKLNDPGLTAKIVIAAKESLYSHCGPILGKSADVSDTLKEEMQRVLGTPIVNRVFDTNIDGFQELERQMKFSLDMMAMPYKKASIVMPGLITATNAESIEGSQLGWRDFMARLYVGDFTMWAQSRVVNWWAVVVTGIVVILLTVLIIVGAFRRRQA